MSGVAALSTQPGGLSLARRFSYLSIAASAAAVCCCACWLEEMLLTASVTPKNTAMNTKKPITNLKNEPEGDRCIAILYHWVGGRGVVSRVDPPLSMLA
jgi:hypothetical protein